MTATVIHTAAAARVSHYLNPRRLAGGLWRHRGLIWQLARRDVEGRYRAAHLGLLWSVLTPLLMLGVYTFAFAVVFKARWGSDPAESRATFALTMFCGWLLYNLFAEVVSRAPGLVVGNVNYVKKVIFPLEVFVPAAVLTGLINMLIGYAAWLVGWLLLNRALPSATVLYLPCVLLPVCLTSAGLGWLLASLGVFIRDLAQAVQVLLQVLFFATPIFYRIEAVPYPYRWVLELNPLSHALEDARRVLMWGAAPDWAWWAFSSVAGALLTLLGYAFFMKSKRAFADVI